MPPFFTRLKPYLRWVIFGLVLFFLAKTLRDHWYEVANLRLTGAAFAFLAISLGLTLMAHIWAGWVWGWIVQSLDLPIPGTWGVQVYLKTNLAKYLPGNLWHFVGRVRAVQLLGTSLGTASLSVLLEPALLVAAALLVALFSSPLTWGWWQLQVPLLAAILAGLHPRILNPGLRWLGRRKTSGLSALAQPTAPARIEPMESAPVNSQSIESKSIESKSIESQSINSKASESEFVDSGEGAAGEMEAPPSPAQPSASPQIKHYPLKVLLGEIGFIVLRGLGFLLVLMAVTPLGWDQVLPLLSAFSLAWLAGMVVPGAPGGIGVFELVAIALLEGQFSPAVLLTSVALYRLISTLAEAGGAGLAWLDERLNGFRLQALSRSDS